MGKRVRRVGRVGKRGATCFYVAIAKKGYQ
jgi:hypothetical protein